MNNIEQFVQFGKLLMRKMNKIDVFAPFIGFPVFFLFGYLLAIMRLSEEIKPFSQLFHLLIIASILSYLTGCHIGKLIHRMAFKQMNINAKLWNDQRRVEIGEKKININLLIVVLFLISFSFLIYEYYMFGAIPLFSLEIETVRIDFSKNGFIHIIALGLLPISIILIVYLLHGRSNAVPVLRKVIVIVLAISLLAILGLGNRGQLLIIVATVIIYRHYAFKKWTLVQMSMVFIVVFLCLSWVKYYRTLLLFGDNYVVALEDDWGLGVLNFIQPGYLTITMNFQIFNEIILTFPGLFGTTFGKFLFNPVLTFFPVERVLLGNYVNEVWNSDFYGALANTYLGVPYVDFGIPGIIFIPMIMGFVNSYTYFRMLQLQTPCLGLFYAYLTVNQLLGLYDFPYSTLASVWYGIMLYFVSKSMERGRYPVNSVDT